MSEACTIGARRLPDADGYILFKNKDFRRAHLVDQTVSTSAYYAVRGIATWDADADFPDQFAGFSIGVNAAGLASCCSNVWSIPGAIPYDCFVERIVQDCETLDQAVQCAEAQVEQNRYGWGNILVATRRELGVIEVRDRVRVERSTDCIVRANHHLLFDEAEFDDDQETTRNRFEVARRRIAVAASFDDVASLCRSHEPEEGQFSICRHGPPYYTVFSYILEVRAYRLRWYSCPSKPCEGQYGEIPILFEFTS